ncbi:MAG: hypothetical protein M3380_07060, partial [Chloroflexota bacterium]|nr:hypothetical protein [Chloroflexota bacterium]
MRSYRWTLIILLLSLLVGAYPAAAVIRPIDPAQPPPPPLLEPAEREKLAALLQWTQPILASEVSPDDRSVLIAHFKLGPEPGAPLALEFLNVRDGTRIPVEERVGTLPPMTEVGWRDGRTAVYVSASEREGPLLVALDSTTGAVTTTPLQLPGEPRSLAPNASRLLVILGAEPERMTAQALTRSPIDRVGGRSPFARPGAMGFDATLEAFQQAGPDRTLAVFDLASQALVP